MGLKKESVTNLKNQMGKIMNISMQTDEDIENFKKTTSIFFIRNLARVLVP